GSDRVSGHTVGGVVHRGAPIGADHVPGAVGVESGVGGEQGRRIDALQDVLALGVELLGRSVQTAGELLRGDVEAPVARVDHHRLRVAPAVLVGQGQGGGVDGGVGE